MSSLMQVYDIIIQDNMNIILAKQYKLSSIRWDD